MDNFSFLITDNVANTVKSVQQNGIAVIKQFLDQKTINDFLKEFHALHKIEDERVSFFENDVQKFLFINIAQDILEKKDLKYPLLNDFKTINSLYQSRFLQDVSKEYFDTEPYYYGVRMQFPHSFGTPDDLSPVPYCIHYDRQRTLKFYFVLNKCDEMSGSLQVLPGEVHLQKAEDERVKFKKTGKKWVEMYPEYECDENDLISLNLEAGDLVVFDTDIPHKQGFIKKGTERKIFMIEAQSVKEWEFGNN